MYNDPNVLFAQLSARQGTPLRGEFTENDPNTFRALQAVLSRDRFYDARLTPKLATYTDGAEDSLTVVRCSVATTIGMFVGGEIEQDNGQVAALFKILDDLQATVFALPWKAVPAPSPSTTDAIRSFEA